MRINLYISIKTLTVLAMALSSSPLHAAPQNLLPTFEKFKAATQLKYVCAVDKEKRLELVKAALEHLEEAEVTPKDVGKVVDFCGWLKEGTKDAMEEDDIKDSIGEAISSTLSADFSEEHIEIIDELIKVVGNFFPNKECFIVAAAMYILGRLTNGERIAKAKLFYTQTSVALTNAGGITALLPTGVAIALAASASCYYGTEDFCRLKITDPCHYKYWASAPTSEEISFTQVNERVVELYSKFTHLPRDLQVCEEKLYEAYVSGEFTSDSVESWYRPYVTASLLLVPSYCVIGGLVYGVSFLFGKSLPSVHTELIQVAALVVVLEVLWFLGSELLKVFYAFL